MDTQVEPSSTSERLNAMRTLMLAEIVLPHEIWERRESRNQGWNVALRPEDEYQSFHVKQAVIGSFRVEHAQVEEVRRKVEMAKIAAHPGPLWDDERRKAALDLGATLRRNPENVVCQLGETAAGRNWLLSQWNHLLLATSGANQSSWGLAETTRMMDLLGMPKCFPKNDLEGFKISDDPDKSRHLINAEIAKLAARQVNDEADNAELRALHCQGFLTNDDPQLKRIGREENAARRVLDRSLKIVAKAKKSVNGKTSFYAPDYKTNPISAPEPTFAPLTIQDANDASNPVSGPELNVTDYKTNPISASEPEAVLTSEDEAPEEVKLTQRALRKLRNAARFARYEAKNSS